MVNISVPFSEDLREKAESAASQRGLSLDEFVRQCVSATIGESRTVDPLFSDKRVFAGDVPHDLAENHDQYLHEGEK